LRNNQKKAGSRREGKEGEGSYFLVLVSESGSSDNSSSKLDKVFLSKVSKYLSKFSEREICMHEVV
jgi:hypothetical protein